MFGDTHGIDHAMPRIADDQHRLQTPSKCLLSSSLSVYLLASGINSSILSSSELEEASRYSSSEELCDRRVPFVSNGADIIAAFYIEIARSPCFHRSTSVAQKQTHPPMPERTTP
jgi:hypothetical protein